MGNLNQSSSSETSSSSSSSSSSNEISTETLVSPRDASYALSSSQSTTLQRLFGRGINPDLSLLPFQMPRMKRDAPPLAKERNTIRIKNICHVDKHSIKLEHLGNDKYRLIFNYSAPQMVYVTIYYFATEYTDINHCTIKFEEKFHRPILDVLELAKKEEKEKEKENLIMNYQGTCYCLPPGMNKTFKQSFKDFIDISRVDVRYYQYTPSLQFYPIVFVFTTTIPTDALYCHIQDAVTIDTDSSIDEDHRNINTEEKNTEQLKNVDNNTKISVEKIEHVKSCTNYCKLIVQPDNTYSCQIVTQKTQVRARTYQFQEIFGLDCAKDPYSGEENLCVICLIQPKNTALLPCRHLCMCQDCARQLLKKSTKCPMCRSYCAETIRISNKTIEDLEFINENEDNSNSPHE